MSEVTRPSVRRALLRLGQDWDLRDQKVGQNNKEP